MPGDGFSKNRIFLSFIYFFKNFSYVVLSTWQYLRKALIGHESRIGRLGTGPAWRGTGYRLKHGQWNAFEQELLDRNYVCSGRS
jgi:hypothetical protein